MENFQSAKTGTSKQAYILFLLLGTKEWGKRQTKHNMKNTKRSEKFFIKKKGYETTKFKRKNIHRN